MNGWKLSGDTFAATLYHGSPAAAAHVFIDKETRSVIWVHKEDEPFSSPQGQRDFLDAEFDWTMFRDFGETERKHVWSLRFKPTFPFELFFEIAEGGLLSLCYR